MPNIKTPNREYPLPHPNNLLQQDVLHIADAIAAIDGDIDALLKEWQQQQQTNNARFRRIKINQLLGDQLLTC